MSDPLTPSRLNEFLGQPEIIADISNAIAAARVRRARGEAWAQDLHSLAYGPPGTGKSSLGCVLASELGCKWFRVTGGTLDSADVTRDWLRRIAGSQESYVWVVDEIHTANLGALEDLYTVMTDGVFIDDGREVPLDLVLYATTNYASSIPRPLRSRIMLALEFRPYGVADLTRIVQQAADVRRREELRLLPGERLREGQAPGEAAPRDAHPIRGGLLPGLGGVAATTPGVRPDPRPAGDAVRGTYRGAVAGCRP